MKSSMSQYLNGIPAHFRTLIRKEAIRKGLTPTVTQLKTPSPLTGKSQASSYRMNPANREALAAAVFVVEDEFESRGDGHPLHSAVVAMRAVRNELYDDLGWNEYPKIIRSGAMPNENAISTDARAIMYSRKEKENV
jgi:hypothetical protein